MKSKQKLKFDFISHGKIRQVAQLGAAVLRKKAQIVDLSANAMQAIIADMQATLADSNGVGIAAPQIYESVCIIIIASRPSSRYPNAPQMEPVVMLNPSFRPLSKDIEKDWEGCLSIPGIRAKVPRYKHIEIDYTDQQGLAVKQRYDDFIARVFQHEYDHLEGKVYLDRVTDSHDIISEKEFQKLIAL